MWDPIQWRAVREGPARRLAAALETAGASSDLVENVLSTYLLLSSDALQNGQLRIGSEPVTLFTRVWTDVLPEALGRVPLDRVLPMLGQAWDATQQYDSAAPWLNHLLGRALPTRTELSDLSAALVRQQLRIQESPRVQLDEKARLDRIRLQPFSPGALHWVAPRALCVHPASNAVLGLHRIARLIWVSTAATCLGAIRCEEVPARAIALPDFLDDRLRGASAPEAIVAAAFNSAFAAATLSNGELLIALPNALLSLEPADPLAGSPHIGAQQSR